MQADLLTHDFKALSVTSKDFADGEVIPSRFTCDGRDINPSLNIEGIPPEAKSLVIIVDDPDAPRGTWLHWLVWNIPVTHHIQEGSIPGMQGANDFHRNTYGGPCPPSGTHRYFFRVYALDDVLSEPEGSSRQRIENSMRDHILAYGELVGRYRRKKS
jgi:Raf kinase inhibitor-like YbhB/YbcL family protein